jgi:hypothetical protein
MNDTRVIYVGVHNTNFPDEDRLMLYRRKNSPIGRGVMVTIIAILELC